MEVISEFPTQIVMKLLSLSSLALSEHDHKRANKLMLATSAIAVEDYLMLVNPYNIRFKSNNPPDFKHLVYFQVREGSYGIFGFIDSIIQPIGKVVHHFIGPRTKYHRIAILVETMLK